MKALPSFLFFFQFTLYSASAQTVLVNIDASAAENPTDPSASGPTITLGPGHYVVRHIGKGGTSTAGQPLYNWWSAWSDPQYQVRCDFLAVDIDDDSIIIGGGGIGSSDSYANNRYYFRLGHTTTLRFGVMDNTIGDNVGGVTLEISPANTEQPALVAAPGLMLTFNCLYGGSYALESASSVLGPWNDIGVSIDAIVGENQVFAPGLSATMVLYRLRSTH